ncbi:MAG TPA: aldo/keto reductase, partial [Ferruginibacter sp.]|nr:aldo/keto reductase [Ferruginibacter sp.]
FALQGFDWLKDRWVATEKINKVKKLATLAAKMEVSLASLSIAWCIKNPHVSTAILGATKKQQLTENLKALDVLPLLTEPVMKKIDDIMNNKPVLPDY